MKKRVLFTALTVVLFGLISCEVEEDYTVNQEYLTETGILAREGDDSGKDEEPDPDDRDRHGIDKVNTKNFDTAYEQYSREGDSGKDEEPDPDDRD